MIHTVENIRDYFAEHNLKQVARETELSYSVIYRLMSGESNPTYETVKRLSEYIDRKQEVLNENR